MDSRLVVAIVYLALTAAIAVFNYQVLPLWASVSSVVLAYYFSNSYAKELKKVEPKEAFVDTLKAVAALLIVLIIAILVGALIAHFIPTL
jgi:uncharacterized membrane protein required for colicin V production